MNKNVMELCNHIAYVLDTKRRNPFSLTGFEKNILIMATDILKDEQNALNQKESASIKIIGCAGVEQWVYDCAGEIVDLTKLDKSPEEWDAEEARLEIGNLIQCSVYNNNLK